MEIKKAALNRFYGLIFLSVLLLYIVDGILPQAQIAIFAGQVPIPAIILKFALTLIVAVSLLTHFYRSGSIFWPRQIKTVYFIFLGYLLVHLLLMLGEYPLNYLLLSYNNYYYFIIIFPFVAGMSVNPKFFTRLMTFIGLPLIAVGMAQYVSSSPLLPVSSADGYFMVSAWSYYDKVRAFSLFSSGLQYGYFLSLFAGFAMFHVIRKRRAERFLALVLLVVISFACYTTFTRNIYIQFVFTVVFSLLLAAYHKSGSRYLGFLAMIMPVIYGVLAALATVYTQSTLLLKLSDSVLLNDESLIMRYSGWANYFNMWTGSDLKTLLFGTGLVSGSRIFLAEEVVIDNSFLAVGLHLGVVGLIIWLVIMWQFWIWLLRITRADLHNGAIYAITSFWSTWISGELFSTGLNYYPLLTLMALPLCLFRYKASPAPSSPGNLVPSSYQLHERYER